MKSVKLGYLYDIIFQSSSKQFHFQSSTSRQSNNTIETSTFPSIYIFKSSNPILQLIFQNFGMFIFLWRHYSQTAEKEPKIEDHVSGVIERSKSIFDRTLKWRVSFWDHLFKILQFWVKERPNLYFMCQWW